MNKDNLKYMLKYQLKDNSDNTQNLFLETYFGSSLVSEVDLGYISDIVANINENTNLKQALNEIRDYVNDNCVFIDDTGYKKIIGYPKEKFNAQDILQIIDKVLGDDKK